MQTEQKIITVSQLNRYVKQLLDSRKELQILSVRGELSNVKIYKSGHYYFNLKDANAQVPCVMFQYQARNLKFRPKDGDEVILSGKASLYEVNGKFQIYVNTMELAGKGNLYILFEQLNKKLAAEGLYRQEHKKAIPKVPKVIGVATSKSGAVIQDIINVSRRRFPQAKIVLAPCSVQGEGASATIIQAIEKLNALAEVDVIIVGRGGGSLEDLWAFNEEDLARAVYASKKPIISAVGHESDTTICDYVADLRAPTPSAAAELALPSQTEIYKILANQERQLKRNLAAKTDLAAIKLDNAKTRLEQEIIAKLRLLNNKFTNLASSPYLLNPYENINVKSENLNMLELRLEENFKQYLNKQAQRIIYNASKLDTLSPLKILNRGYAMVTTAESATPLVSVKDISEQEKLNLHMSDGLVKVEVQAKTDLERVQ